jgi:hypothetical protein
MALARLEECGLAVPLRVPSKGRPVQVWVSTKFTRSGGTGQVVWQNGSTAGAGTA